jgi:hypothetical protein
VVRELPKPRGDSGRSTRVVCTIHTSSIWQRACFRYQIALLPGEFSLTHDQPAVSIASYSIYAAAAQVAPSTDTGQSHHGLAILTEWHPGVTGLGFPDTR